ncbi:MAG: Twin-arginine translocation pathway signal, partial [uncultured Thiotrichaceae bacterium]
RQPQALVAWQFGGGELKSLIAEQETIAGCRGYMADLAYAEEAGLLAVTSPRGNRVTFWDVGTLAFVSALELPEPSGIEYLAAQNAFVVSGAKGGVYQIAVEAELQLTTLHQLEHTQWDNHLLLG